MNKNEEAEALESDGLKIRTKYELNTKINSNGESICYD